MEGENEIVELDIPISDELFMLIQEMAAAKGKTVEDIIKMAIREFYEKVVLAGKHEG